MKLRILGSGAGGGLPQWNCACPQCHAARSGAPQVPARTQSSVAVSSDGAQWLLLNASPDVRTQLQHTPELAPREGSLRDTPLAAVALTNADLDHSMGLLVLREGGAPPLYCTPRVADALTRGLSVLPTLGAYGPVQVRPLHDGQRARFANRAGDALGLSAEVLTVESKAPPYMLPHLTPAEAADTLAGDTVGLRLHDEGGSGCVAYLPGVKTLDDRVRAWLEPASVLLLDGTCFTDDELVTMGVSARTARTMGHAPLTGPGGSLAFISTLPKHLRVFLVHLNNTNPVLREGSPERRVVEDAGVTVAHDGLLLSV